MLMMLHVVHNYSWHNSPLTTNMEVKQVTVCFTDVGRYFLKNIMWYIAKLFNIQLAMK